MIIIISNPTRWLWCPLRRAYATTFFVCLEGNWPAHIEIATQTFSHCGQFDILFTLTGNNKNNITSNFRPLLCCMHIQIWLKWQNFHSSVTDCMLWKFNFTYQSRYMSLNNAYINIFGCYVAIFLLSLSQGYFMPFTFSWSLQYISSWMQCTIDSN